jgi:ankyrin repeat protein
VGNTPLHYAAESCKDERYLARLLELGNPLDTPNSLGRRPLHWAVQNDNAKVAAFLVKQGASLEGLAEWVAAPENQCSPRAAVLVEKLGKLAKKN